MCYPQQTLCEDGRVRAVALGWARVAQLVCRVACGCQRRCDIATCTPGFRAFHPQDVHMTLSFLGACGEQVARMAFSALASGLREGKRVVRRHLARLFAMGPKGRYSALSAIVNEGNGEAVDLRQWRDRVADAASVSRDKARHCRMSPWLGLSGRRHATVTAKWGYAGLTSVVLPPDRVRLTALRCTLGCRRRLPYGSS